MQRGTKNEGSVLILAMIALVVVSIWTAAIATMANANMQIARDFQKSNQAFHAAESGLEIMRYHLSRIKMPSSTPPSQHFHTIITDLNSELNAIASMKNEVSVIKVGGSGDVPDVLLDGATNQRFSAKMAMDGTYSTLAVSITGKVDPAFARTVQVKYTIAPYKHPIFKYGMASKGPLDFSGNPTTTGVTANWEADMYTEGLNLGEWDAAVHLGGNATLAGDVEIGGSGQFVYDAALNIAGDVDQTAVDNHVTNNVGPVDFPAPDTARFAKYASTDPNAIIDSTTDLSKGLTLTNATITANTNPVFLRGVTIEGILLVERPNIVTFDNVILQGIIVEYGSAGDSSTNQLNFTGNFASTDYPSGAEFHAIRQEVGTAILAPSFATSFVGNFAAIDGVMATHGLSMDANTDASVGGTIINYSDSPTTIAGNVVLNFDRANMVEIPAGFDTLRILAFDSSSYSLVF